MKKSAIVAISGLGCICAAGKTLPECTAALFGGIRNPRPPQRFVSGHSVSYPVFEIPDDLPSLQPSGKTELTRTASLALIAAREALHDAGIDSKTFHSKRVGVCVGTTVGSAMNNEDFYREYRLEKEPDMIAIKRYLKSNPAAAIARECGFTGPCQTVVNACSSGTDAVGLGSLWIEAGICDIVIAGGADELCHVTYNGFISLMITDSTPCKPFDRDRKGLNLGEGAAMLVIESEASLLSRNKKAKAFVLGYGSSCDAHHLTAPHPEGRGLRQAISETLRTGGINTETIAFINAHGTGTPDNDKVESKVLNDLLPGVPFFSTKGYTGHTLGAAGAIEAAFTVACLEQGKIPKNIGFDNPDPELASPPVAKETATKGSVALSESLAFGGHNAVIAIGLERGML